MITLTAQQQARFWAKVQKTESCWLWMACRGGSNGGYGKLAVNHKPFYAHRVAYEIAIGPIPDGLQLDHLCRNPICVNPAHLEPVTSRVNLLRGNTLTAKQAAQTHCKRGHLLEGENLKIAHLKKGKRECRICAYMRHEKWRVRRRLRQQL